MPEQQTIKESVRSNYAQKAREGGVSRSACCNPATDLFSSNTYDAQEVAWLPTDANIFSLGCGNPTALAELKSGEVVLDLGSGAGLDVLLSARRVGPTGLAYGLDMTDEMLEVARRNQERTGVPNARFLKGDMENVPLPDSSVDVIISNCVVNLSPDKDRVLQEAFRVLKSGGRIAISDIVVRGELPESVRHDLEAWSGCIAGALSDQEYSEKLQAAGFAEIDIETTRTYSLEDVEGGECFRSLAELPLEEKQEAVSRLTSSFIRARKPARENP